MKKILLLAFSVSALLLGGCTDKTEKDAKPTFMFWCFRKEVVSSEYRVPNMKTPASAAYIQSKLKAIPGIVDSSFDIEKRILTVNYKSSTIRAMNIEEGIALAGFAVNNRPANPKAKLPEGLE
ncbi:MAG: heavy-metal-associated domain-containing protein [Verrucomicrobiota bacterium]